MGVQGFPVMASWRGGEDAVAVFADGGDVAAYAQPGLVLIFRSCCTASPYARTMTSSYPGQSDLQHRLRRACLEEYAKPLVLMMGAGVSAGAVPGTAEMVHFFERSVSSDPDDASDFMAAVRSLEPERQYQAAARFLIERAGLPHLNRVVRGAVLRARSPRLPLELARQYLSDEQRLKKLEEDFAGWAVPQGLKAVGQIMRLVPPEVRGPVITTNFDPLIEISLRASGFEPYSLPVDDDGSVAVPDSTAVVQPVVHLHGYWRLGDTLHTGAQLTAPRHKLLGSLRQILSNSTCLIVGYGGWDDVLTSAILSIVREGGQRELEILWACHSSDARLGAVSSAELPGRIQPYVSVDSNSLFLGVHQALESRIGPSARRPRSAAPKPVPLLRVAGWLNVDEGFVATQEARSGDHRGALSYFDGRDPSWVDVASGRIPILDDAQRLIDDLQQGSVEAPATLLEGPTGEGKSTVARQAAVELARTGQVQVLWAEPGGQLDVTTLASTVYMSRRVFLFVDDADLRTREIAYLIGEIKRQQRDDIRLVLAARDTDWNRSLSRSSATILRTDLDVRDLSGLSRNDAEKIVEAWSKLGNEGLGHLAQIPSSRRGEVLHRESLNAGSSALLGALLATRHGGEFTDHIRNLLARLQRVDLPGGRNLLEAYATVCLLPQLGLPPIHVDHLALTLGVSSHEAQVLAVERLGREAAASRHGTQVIPRHPRIAEAAVALMSEFGLVGKDVLASYVFKVVHELRDQQWDQDLVRVAFCGQDLKDEENAIAAIDAAVAADPTNLRLGSAKIGVYRTFGRLSEALSLASTTWDAIDAMSDTWIAMRRFLREWARCEGLKADGRVSAGLCACALLDLPNIEELDVDNAARALSGLAIGLGLFKHKDTEKINLWRGVFAEEAMKISPRPETRHQAEGTLAIVSAEGFESPPEPKARRQAIVEAIGYSLSLTTMGPSKRYRHYGKQTQQLFSLLGL